jgi:hypothetical protein
MRSEEAVRNVYSYPELDGVDNRVAEDAAAYESEGLPNRLLNAREVAKFVGCHEETVRRAYWRGLLRCNASASEEGGFTRMTYSTGLRAEHQRGFREESAEKGRASGQPKAGGAHRAPARERSGAKGPRERPSRGVGRSPT